MGDCQWWIEYRNDVGGCWSLGDDESCWNLVKSQVSPTLFACLTLFLFKLNRIPYILVCDPHLRNDGV